MSKWRFLAELFLVAVVAGILLAAITH
jgi:hypothetical protein